MNHEQKQKQKPHQHLMQQLLNEAGHKLDNDLLFYVGGNIVKSKIFSDC